LLLIPRRFAHDPWDVGHGSRGRPSKNVFAQHQRGDMRGSPTIRIVGMAPAFDICFADPLLFVALKNNHHCRSAAASGR